MSSGDPRPRQVELEIDPESGNRGAAWEAAKVAALEALDAGQLVIVPTETVYGVAAREDRPAAVERLEALKGKRTSPYSLAVAEVAQVADRVHTLRGPARRIAERWWPGPVTQVLPAFQGPDLGLRVVGHPWTREMLASCPSPVLLPSANRAGEPAPLELVDVESDLAAEVALAVNGGRCALGESSTVVRPAIAGLRILREGVVSREDLERHALGHVLVVCSGNTCRSPMGALLLERALAGRGLDVPGFLAPAVRSAGTWAGHGVPASRGAEETMEARRLSLDAHHSTPLSPKELAGCDLVLCMTDSHRAAVLELLVGIDPDKAPLVELFAPDGTEVVDPFGGTVAVYARCADQLEAMAIRRAELLCPSPTGTPS
jgi:L-threonylcarbamoyladenylate synthase